MAKQLRIEAAELTDVGRKRSENQDNLAQRIPDDPQELEQDGALFVVADGMGGHAAGEVASTVAVQTISSTYFEAAQGDVLQGLAQAIKQANEAILTIARESAARAGMGTTLVAAVLCQGILYVANIGDSRAYLLRNGKLRQLTEDHSWVAEQVRAGVLTEEQARNHVHRNVITRSLGTQVNVTADVFVEPAKEGDTLLLCSDGLHGYVNDTTIAEVTAKHPPDEAAKILVDLANDAGGPDNITVSIFHISEMPEAPPEVLEKLQLLKDQPRPTRPVPIVAKPSDKPAVAAPAPPEPLTLRTAAAAEDADATPVPARPRRRVGAWLVRVAAVILLLAASVAAWDYTLGPFAQSRVVANQVSTDLSKTRSDITNLSSHSVADQLSLLAADQAQLERDLSLSLTGQQKSDIQNLLTNELTPAVRTAITTYQAQAHIVPLSNTFFSMAPIPGACANAIFSSLVAIGAPKGTPPSEAASTFFFSTTTNKQLQVVQLERDANNQLTTVNCASTTYGNNILYATRAGNGVAALVSDGTTPPSITTFTPEGAPTQVLKLPPLAAGTTIPFFAYSPKFIAVIERNSSDTLAIYKGPTFAPTAVTRYPLTLPVRSLAFGANAALYLLMGDGTLATFVPGASTSLHTVGNLQILPALPTGQPDSYTSATPVPTVPPTTAAVGQYRADMPVDDTPTPPPTPTATPLPAPLTGPSTPLQTASGIAISTDAVPYVAVTDGKNHRIILLNATGVDLGLVRQYVDPSQLDGVTLMSFDAAKDTLFAVAANTLIQIQLT